MTINWTTDQHCDLRADHNGWTALVAHIGPDYIGATIASPDGYWITMNNLRDFAEVTDGRADKEPVVLLPLPLLAACLEKLKEATG